MYSLQDALMIASYEGNHQKLKLFLESGHNVNHLNQVSVVPTSVFFSCLTCKY